MKRRDFVVSAAVMGPGLAWAAPAPVQTLAQARLWLDQLERTPGAKTTGAWPLVAVLEHCNKYGEPKILEQCSLPLTGQGVVDLIISDLAVFAVDKKQGGLTLKELAPGVTLDEVRAKTGAALDAGAFA